MGWKNNNIFFLKSKFCNKYVLHKVIIFPLTTEIFNLNETRSITIVNYVMTIICETINYDLHFNLKFLYLFFIFYFDTCLDITFFKFNINRNYKARHLFNRSFILSSYGLCRTKIMPLTVWKTWERILRQRIWKNTPLFSAIKGIVS